MRAARRDGGPLWKGGPVQLPTTVMLDGQPLRIKYATTATLLDVIGRGDWWSLIPGLLPAEDAQWINLRLVNNDDDLEMNDVWHCATELGGQLAGTGSWWAATRLLASARNDWLSFDAWCLQHGYDPLNGPLWRISAAMYSIRQAGVVVHGKPDETEAALDRLRADLWMPPLHVAGERWTPQDEAAAWQKSMAAIGASGSG